MSNDGKRHLELLTTSEAKTFQRCKREHQIAYRDGYRPVRDDDAKRFGTLFHAGREAMFLAWMNGLSGNEPFSAALAAVQASEADPFELVRVEELLRGYFSRYAKQELDILAVEVEFNTPLINPDTGAASRTFTFGGKLDAIVRERRTGRVLVNELKTSSENILPGSTYWKRLRLDPQVSNYFPGARSLGFDVVGCQYDVVGKVALKPYKQTPVEKWQVVSDAAGKKYAESIGVFPKGTKWGDVAHAAKLELLATRPDLFRLSENQHAADETPDEYRARVRASIDAEPDEYFMRGEVVRFETEEIDAARDLWAVANEVRAARKGNALRNPNACMRWGVECPYFGVCSGVDSVDDPMKFRRIEIKHEELNQGEAA